MGKELPISNMLCPYLEGVSPAQKARDMSCQRVEHSFNLFLTPCVAQAQMVDLLGLEGYMVLYFSI